MKRREFLKNAVVSAAGMSTVSLPMAASSTESGSHHREEGTYDVIVVGGGFAGITAARDLSKSGASVLLVEARPRLGGRTFTSHFAGHKLDLGGTWFGWGQPNIWAEKMRYDLPINESASVNSTTFIWYENGKRKEGGADVFWPPLNKAYAKFYAPAATVLNRPYDPLFNDGETLRKLDSISADQAINELDATEKEKGFLRSFAAINGHSDPKKSSYLDQLRWIALSGFNQDFMWANVSQFKFEHGTQSLIENMMADSSAQVKLGTAVTHVEHTSSEALVTTNRGETLVAKYVVMAAPLNVLKNIQFSPNVSAVKRKAFEQGHTGSGIKIYIRLKGKHPVMFATGSADMPINFLWTEYDDENQILVGFGKDPTSLDVYDDEAVQAAVRQYIPDAEVLEAFSYDWNIDPYSKGTWCMYPPGMLTEALDELNRPEGRVYFAGADLAYGWRGFIDGAIESGARNAQVISKILTKI